MRLKVVGVLDKLELSVIQSSYLLQRLVIISHHNPCSKHKSLKWY